MARTYGNGSNSQIGTQIRTNEYIKKALIEARKEMYFGQLADVTSMPKNMGKTIKKYHYLPLLDDANINDQGIDAAGATLVNTQWTAWNSAGVVQGTAYASEGAAWTAAGLNGSVSRNGGNLYGSTKDIGAISGKLPTLSENGGRVNRVGFKRVELEGSLEKFGFFDEYTQESLDFDTDADLMMHINREMLNGAMELTEDALQIDLLTSAATIQYPGAAVSNATITAATMVTYGDLLRLAIRLDDNRTPKQTKVITGTRMVDTRTIAGGRVLYCGSELQPTLEAMVDLHGNQAFVPVHQYAAGTQVLTGEIGSVGHFRIVIVPEMLKWAGKGGDASATATHYETNSRYDVFPMLCVGDESFTTIGFQTDGKTVKFKITHKAPGKETADKTDPYGETGFMSIKWYYGFLPQRTERLGLIKTSALL
jgi:N4-gp56 family major capsid protein